MIEFECKQCHWFRREPFDLLKDTEHDQICSACKAKDSDRTHSELARQWRESLKKGDKVIRSYHASGRRAYFEEEVTHTTARQIVLGGLRFRKDNGRLVGNHYSGQDIVPATPYFMALLKRAYNRERFFGEICRPSHRNPLTDEEIEVMLTALDAHREAHNGE